MRTGAFLKNPPASVALYAFVCIVCLGLLSDQAENHVVVAGLTLLLLAVVWLTLHRFKALSAVIQGVGSILTAVIGIGAIVVMIAVPFAALYFLVKFVKWAWMN